MDRASYSTRQISRTTGQGSALLAVKAHTSLPVRTAFVGVVRGRGEDTARGARGQGAAEEAVRPRRVRWHLGAAEAQIASRRIDSLVGSLLE